VEFVVVLLLLATNSLAPHSRNQESHRRGAENAHPACKGRTLKVPLRGTLPGTASERGKGHV